MTESHPRLFSHVPAALRLRSGDGPSQAQFRASRRFQSGNGKTNRHGTVELGGAVNGNRKALMVSVIWCASETALKGAELWVWKFEERM